MLLGPRPNQSDIKEFQSTLWNLCVDGAIKNDLPPSNFLNEKTISKSSFWN